MDTAEHLDTVTAQLNDCSRETLGWDTSAERIGLLLTTNQRRCCNDH